MITSDYQAKYIVHELDRVYANDEIAKLSGLMFDAQITPTPHQIDAALFALNTPNTKGVILADEVGLGKTIEAGIVIMQCWSERKREILIISPSSLRQQWSQELREKFNLNSTILDSKSIKTIELLKTNGIYICSYEFANRNINKLSKGWDLVVLDEAHKLRNFYTKKNGIAGGIAQIVKWSNKALLLTATPLQNKIEELYGLITVTDPDYFHSLDVFKKRYKNNDNPDALVDLRSRIERMSKRTLRKEANKYIKYTKRITKTVTFEPSGDEKKLYELVDDYLHREKLYAFASSQRHLSALILRKRLGSSSFAVASTLRKIAERMREEYFSGKIRNNKGELFGFDDLNSEELEALENEGRIYDNYSLSSAQERAEFKAEIEELESYARFAESIKTNVKAEHLIEAIKLGFDTLESKAARKAIIFTESTLTQDYIAKILERDGFAGKYILFNGQNNSQQANEIYNKWKIANKDSDIITGNESADKRKALIDKFKEDDIEIMIATEAASEGINLQFCSMMINYDLPWNPQRIEQRIGRIHRMGQKYDVVVVNFSNISNIAEQRILELLTDKFNLFKTTFGASNEVLGVIESGLDFESKISDILNTCRTDEEIDQGFKKLQEEFKTTISSEQKAVRAKIFDSLDPNVQDRFQKYNDEANKTFNRFEQMFMDLTRYELKNDACFDDEHVFTLNNAPTHSIQTGKYFYKTNRIENARQYKYADDLAEYVRKTAKNKETLPAELVFSIGESDRASTLAKTLKGQSGQMIVCDIEFDIKSGKVDLSESHVMASAELDNGEMLDLEGCKSIMDLNAISVSPLKSVESDVLDIYFDRRLDELRDEVKERNAQIFLDKKDILERQYKDKIIELEIKLDKIAAMMHEKEKNERNAKSSEERLKFAAEKQNLNKKMRTLKRQIFDIEDSLDYEIDEKIKLAQKASSGNVIKDELFRIKFKIV